MNRRALVTGANGQVGSYMCEELLAKGYKVYGMLRHTSTINLWRLAGILDRITLVEGDLTDDASLRRVLQQTRPQEVYHFASQSHVGVSFLEPIHTLETTGLGTLRLFEAIRFGTALSDHVRVYYAASSEQFGNVSMSPQNELTPMEPISPYGCAKLLAYRLAQTYRMAYGMYIACGIAFNHESPRRSEEFVTRKITRTLAAITAGAVGKLHLGQVGVQRDWSHARDIAQAAWLMLQHPVAEDFILASGESHTVQDFYRLAFSLVGLVAEDYVQIDPRLFRPTELLALRGDATKARQLLKWSPQYTFWSLVKEMVDADLALVGVDRPVPSDQPERVGAPEAVAAVAPGTDIPEGAA